MDPITLSATAIATLVITKAFEKSGEVLGEKALEQSGKFSRSKTFVLGGAYLDITRLLDTYLRK
ncbi:MULTISPECIES: hypothetical protein [unclassified Coleofasciculus]|uniref:hypothetical protein n=1 Tax=unclassified Coleofasciculus TaxID=2692782 RepID=UPI00187FFC63|nr:MULTISPECIES: hypothetical protein [unclassified Coleofasciculus]MBE9130205.1 hypothetical protein [Coleofasciculus sp. LEGE 07081]MBE9150401.1 hypothetical protein [Coleofasciculus sp. LEGE 07092]